MTRTAAPVKTISTSVPMATHATRKYCSGVREMRFRRRTRSDCDKGEDSPPERRARRSTRLGCPRGNRGAQRRPRARDGTRARAGSSGRRAGLGALSRAAQSARGAGRARARRPPLSVAREAPAPRETPAPPPAEPYCSRPSPSRSSAEAEPEGGAVHCWELGHYYSPVPDTRSGSRGAGALARLARRAAGDAGDRLARRGAVALVRAELAGRRRRWRFPRADRRSHRVPRRQRVVLAAGRLGAASDTAPLAAAAHDRGRLRLVVAGDRAREPEYLGGALEFTCIEPYPPAFLDRGRRDLAARRGPVAGGPARAFFERSRRATCCSSTPRTWSRPAAT